jgi:hypothetical protein
MTAMRARVGLWLIRLGSGWVAAHKKAEAALKRQSEAKIRLNTIKDDIRRHGLDPFAVAERAGLGRYFLSRRPFGGPLPRPSSLAALEGAVVMMVAERAADHARKAAE